MRFECGCCKATVGMLVMAQDKQDSHSPTAPLVKLVPNSALFAQCSGKKAAKRKANDTQVEA